MSITKLKTKKNMKSVKPRTVRDVSGLNFTQINVAVEDPRDWQNDEWRVTYDGRELGIVERFDVNDPAFENDYKTQNDVGCNPYQLVFNPYEFKNDKPMGVVPLHMNFPSMGKVECFLKTFIRLIKGE